MILTQCAVCATELGLSLGKKCGRCSTRYCGAACQAQHWKEGGHDTLCKKIKKAGGAEQYNANKNYAEAVSVAANACAEDTKGQTCFICTQALHWKTKEGLVRGCSCRGTAGFAHVSCLAEQAKILFAEGEENHLGLEAMDKRWKRWFKCSLCEQRYHGVVRCALGWACWKTYVGRPATDSTRNFAITQLGLGLTEADRYEDALIVQEAELSMLRHLRASEGHMITVQTNLAISYDALGRRELALNMLRDVYLGTLKLKGLYHTRTIIQASNFALALFNLGSFEEAKTLLREMLPVAQRVCGERNHHTLRMRSLYAQALYRKHGATLDDFREAVNTFEETAPVARRVLGGAHPLVKAIEGNLKVSRAALRTHEELGRPLNYRDMDSICEAMEATMKR